jgi:hypothetical protein
LCFSHVTVPHIIISIVVSTVTVFFLGGGRLSLLFPSPLPPPAPLYDTLHTFSPFTILLTLRSLPFILLWPSVHTHSHMRTELTGGSRCCGVATLTHYTYIGLCAHLALRHPAHFLLRTHPLSFFLIAVCDADDRVHTHIYIFFFCFSPLLAAIQRMRGNATARRWLLCSWFC